jgi:small subunit ribosomal protein S16
MVVIRLARGGAKKRPFYHLVVADKRRSRNGRFIEEVGYFNPIATGKDVRLTINMERVAYWISKGAQPSERVQSLVKTYKEIATEGPVSDQAQA